MELHIEQIDLAAFAKVAKTARPEFIFVESQADQVRLSAPGLAMTVWATAPARIVTSGRLAFDASAFFKAVLAQDNDAILLSPKGLLQNGFLAKLEPVEAEPGGHPLSSALSVNLPVEPLMAAMPLLLTAMGRDEGRVSVYGVHMDRRGFLEATDGHRLFRSNVLVAEDDNEANPGTIPNPAMLGFDKILKAFGARKPPESVYLAIDEEETRNGRAIELCASWGSLRLGVSCYEQEGSWPDTDEVLKGEPPSAWTALTAELDRACTKLCKLGEGGEAVSLTVGRASLTAENSGAKVSIPVLHFGEITKIGINPTFLKAALNHTEDSTTLLLSAALSPVKIPNAAGLWLVMPVRLA